MALLTPFVGREADFAVHSELLELPTTPLLTLIGIGGMGETILALELARSFSSGRLSRLFHPRNSRCGGEASPTALAYLTQALSLCHTLGKRHEESRFVLGIGELDLILGDYGAVTQSFQAGLRLVRESGNRAHEGTAHLIAGVVPFDQGNYMRASEALRTARDVLRDIGVRMYEACALAYLGRLAESGRLCAGA